MAQKRFIWKLYISYIIVIVAALGAATWYFSNFFHNFYIEQTAEKLTTYAKLYSPQIAPLVSDSDSNKIETLCKEFGKLSSARITIINPAGVCLGDSDEQPAKMENHSDRIEFKQAIENGFGKSIRFSHTDQKNMMYVALPIKENDKVIAVVRTAVSVSDIQKTLQSFYFKIALAGIFVALTAAILTMVIIIFNDAARFQKLETIRKDFVSSVSHELKTPITSIKGFTETLLDGSVKEPAKYKEFLEIILKHSQRLDSIIDDLLSLSRLEDNKSRGEIALKTTYLKSLLTNAIEFSNIKAKQKQITINLNCLDDLKVNANTVLLEQAVFNLIDNAIKYSPEKSKITVTAFESENQILISVEDNGNGIEEKHLSRIFERFYVVDKSRSRKLGGTGLGLAIVKHIAQVHRGTVEVESTVGKGSKFTIKIPL